MALTGDELDDGRRVVKSLSESGIWGSVEEVALLLPCLQISGNVSSSSPNRSLITVVRSPVPFQQGGGVLGYGTDDEMEALAVMVGVSSEGSELSFRSGDVTEGPAEVELEPGE